MKRQWRLRNLLLMNMIAFNAFFLLLITLSIWAGVSYILTEQTRLTRLDKLDSNRSNVAGLLRQTEEMAIAISTNRNLLDVLDVPLAQDMFETVKALRDVDYWLNGYAAINSQLSGIYVYSVNKVPTVSSLILPLDQIPWKQELARLDEYDSIWVEAREIRRGLAESTRVLTHVTKVFNRRGDVVGYVEINLRESAIRQLLQSNRDTVVPDQVFLLIDPNRRLMSTIVSGSGVGLPGGADWMQGVGPGNGQHFSLAKIAGESYMYISTPGGNGTWRLVNIIRAEEVFRHVSNLRGMVLLIGLIALVMTVPVATYLSNRIIRPVDSLVQGFETIKKGVFTLRMEHQPIVEFHVLLQSYNLMVRRLQALLEQLEEEHRAKRDAELRMLQSQINPHFLYNTLDMINWMAAVKGASDVSLMAARLARLFRISLGKDGPFIPLSEELEHSLTYAQIQQERFGDRFLYREDVAASYTSYLVPRVILQPFVENAIIHGFDGIDDKQAEVRVRAEDAEGGQFLLIVEDNGSGLPGTAAERPQPSSASGSSGYGIGNVNDRIQLYFGNDYGVKLHNRKEGGVRVEILLPVIRSAAEAARLGAAGLSSK